MVDQDPSLSLIANSADTYPHKNTWTDRDVEEFWDSVADIYIKENNRVQEAHDQRFTFACEHLNLSHDMSVINITSRDCGALPFLSKQKKNLSICNVEISGQLNAIAEKLHPQATIKKISTYSDLPFRDQSFDRVLTLETLEHVENPLKFCQELFRIAKPGATMVLSCPPATAEPAYQIYSLLFGGHGEGPHRFLWPKEVKKILSRSGWQLRKHKGTLLIPAGPLFLQKWGESLLEYMPILRAMGVRQFYVCQKK